MRDPPRIPAPFRLTALLLSVGFAACASGVSYDPGTVDGEPLETPFAETFSIVERDGYRIVDIEASVVTWGGSAGGRPSAPVSCSSRAAWSRPP